MGDQVVITPDPVAITPDVPGPSTLGQSRPSFSGNMPPSATGTTGFSAVAQGNPTAGLPGGTTGAPVIASDTAIGVGAGAIGAASLAIPGVGPAVGRSILGAAKGIVPIAGMEAINYARQNLPGGKYIPPGAELLPLFMGGNKPGEGPPPSSSRAEGQLAEDLPIPAGKVPMPGPRPNGPYSGPNTPQFMEPAQSGTIAKHGYIPGSQTMVTEFKNGKVYDARGVPKEVYDNFRNAESQGSFYAQNIKGRYNTAYRGSVSPTK